MFAARASGTVRKKVKKPSNLPKVSSEKDNRYNVSGPMQQKARRLALLRELEMNFYLKTCELSYEYTVAYTSGMPHRCVMGCLLCPCD
uniref:Voltage-gated potassium channel subunit beta-1 n=1 Tax=Sphaerodactylus townsendi TaxID=933632 RepID=A0ACB8FB90_9SAUR